ncbi:MAG: BrnT family toxin [Methylobacterium sp.]
MINAQFDPAKDAINRQRHGLSLLFGDRIFDDPDHLVIPSIHPQDGEERFKVVGAVESKVYTAVFTWREDRARFISVRRSNSGEERAYRSGG